jgi:hypothetical protein
VPIQTSYGANFTNTWTDYINVYDGNTTTYGYFSASTGSTIYGETGGYGFQSGGAYEIPSNAALITNGVTLQIWYSVGTVNRWSSVSVQAYNGATALGSPTSITASLSTLATNNTTAILSGITLSDILNSNFKVRVTGVRTGTASNTFYLRQMSVSANYSTKMMWTGTQWKPFVIWTGSAWSSNYNVWTGSTWA